MNGPEAVKILRSNLKFRHAIIGKNSLSISGLGTMVIHGGVLLPTVAIS
jgi:hypothetical protein